MSVPYDPDLLPSLKEMRATWSGPPISLWDYANIRGDMELGYAFASIFCPDFVEAHGGVFLAEQFSEESFANWHRTLDGDLTRIESVMNHAHVCDFFLNAKSDDLLEDRVGQRFGQVLALCWRAALTEAFPGRPITVDYQYDDSVGGDPTGEVTFFQIR